MSIGIIAEYNPFHNGHLYQINKIKEMYPDATIICCMGTNFLERGDTSLINKWDKTIIALEYGIDLVIELPFVFSSQSADIFAKGSIAILNSLAVDKIVFGTETKDINVLINAADIENTDKYQELVKEYLDKGINYPTAMSKALYDISKITIDKPNDLLGLSYIKEIKRISSTIEPVNIVRTNDYHSLELNNSIVSASSIRKALKEDVDVHPFVPQLTNVYLNNNLSFIDYYFPFLKYKILTTPDLSIYQTVDEGIESRIMKYINKSTSLDELINNIKTKRYTYNKLKRMFVHILCCFTKEEAKHNDIEYIRVLGFNNNGKKYLNSIKKDINIPIITGYSNIKSDMLNIEYRVNTIYASIFNEGYKNILIEREIKEPIIK